MQTQKKAEKQILLFQKKLNNVCLHNISINGKIIFEHGHDCNIGSRCVLKTRVNFDIKFV